MTPTPIPTLAQPSRHRARTIRFDVAAHDKKANAHNQALRFQETLEAKGSATKADEAALDALWQAAHEAGIARDARQPLQFGAISPEPDDDDNDGEEGEEEEDELPANIPHDAPPAVKAAAKRKQHKH